jgi:hypothetical protein
MARWQAVLLLCACASLLAVNGQVGDVKENPAPELEVSELQQDTKSVNESIVAVAAGLWGSTDRKNRVHLYSSFRY